MRKEKSLSFILLFVLLLVAFYCKSVTPDSKQIPQEGLTAEGNKEWEQAIKIYKDALAKEPNNPDLWIRISDIENHLKDYPKAAEAMKEAIKLEPQNILLYVQLSEIYAVAQKPKEALSAIDQAVQLGPKNIEFLKKRAILANWANDTDKSKDSYSRILELDKNDKDAQTGLKRIQDLLKSAAAETANEGLKAEGEEKWENAIKIYQDILTKNPNNPDLWKRVSDIEYHLTHYEHAADALKQAIKYAPKRIEFYVALSETYAVDQKPKEALAAIDEAVQLQPKNIDFLKRRAVLANWAKDIDKAKDSYTRILALDKNDKDAQLNLKHLQEGFNPASVNSEVIASIPPEGLLAEDAEKWETAIKIYTDALTKDPNKPDLWKRISDIEIHLKQYAKAEDALKQAIQYAPKRTEFYVALSETYAVDKKPKEALEAIEGALKIEPNNIDFLKKRTILADWAKGFGQGQANVPRTPHAKPGTAEYFSEKSQIYAAEQNDKQALVEIEKAVELDPDNLKYLKSQAIFANELNKLDLAEESYCRILEIDYRDRDALLGVAQLETNKNYLDFAAVDYANYLILFPDSKETWIDYAKVESWRSNFRISFDALECYRARYGATKSYWSEKARLLAMAWYPKASLCIVRPLLRDDPCNYDLLFTKALALDYNNQPSEALQTLEFMEDAFPDHKSDNKELSNIVRTPIRSNINALPYSSVDTDSININQIKVVGQYFLTPETSLLLGVREERQHVDRINGLQTISGGRSIWDSAQWTGITSQLCPEIRINGQAGIGEIKTRNPFVLYQIGALFNPNDILAVTLQNGRDLYAVSPRAVSLSIQKTATRMAFTFEPSTQRYIVGEAEYSTFSDQNRYWSATFAPRAGVIRSQYVSLDIGAYGNWFGFAKQLITNGYYSPFFYQIYEATAAIYIAPNENIGYSITMGAGAQKDNTMAYFGFVADFSVQAIYGIYSDWQLILSAGASLRNSNSGNLQIRVGNYRVYTASVTMTKRF